MGAVFNVTSLCFFLILSATIAQAYGPRAVLSTTNFQVNTAVYINPTYVFPVSTYTPPFVDDVYQFQVTISEDHPEWGLYEQWNFCTPPVAGDQLIPPSTLPAGILPISPCSPMGFWFSSSDGTVSISQMEAIIRGFQFRTTSTSSIDRYVSFIAKSNSRGWYDFLWATMHLGAIPLPPPPPAAARDVHFWVEEGQFLFGRLMVPPPLNINFHNTLDDREDHPFHQPSAMTGCSTAPVFALVTGPLHHTITPTGYTPQVAAFAIATDGNFTYISLPNATTPVVWNGYDRFIFSAQCASEPVQSGTAFVNVVYTSAASHNANATAFGSSYTTGGTGSNVLCSGTCRNVSDGMWYARHTLPRVWDVTGDESGTLLKPTFQWSNETKDADGLELEWSSNYAVVSLYGTIGNMAVRFPTFEEVTWKPGQDFVSANVGAQAAATSTGFDQGCLDLQGASALHKGSDVWEWSTYPTVGTLGTKYSSSTSWYQKFGGKHTDCNIFQSNRCLFAPLLTPRTGQVENNAGVWKLEVRSCVLQWQAKFTWNAMRTQLLHSSNGNKAWNIAGPGTGAGQIADGYTITANIYNEAVQPNSWTDYTRGFAWLNKKYILKIVLKQDTDFQFTLGIDIFTVDLQWFRYQNGANDHAFGYNMIMYPTTLNAPLTPQSAPDRRIVGYKWNTHEWVAPNNAQCPGCTSRVNGSTNAAAGATVCRDHDAEAAGPDSWYTDASGHDGNCPVTAARVYLFKGPMTTSSDCTNTADAMTIQNVAGISPQSPSGSTCQNTFQNITLRGVATGSSAVTAESGFGFEGMIVLTFLLANGEHPHFQITPKLYVQSLSVQGSFAGTTATCRGSPKWPVVPTTNLSSSLPTFLCEEVDARTFGPTDWAIILFDIKDVDPSLVTLRKLYVVFSGLNKNIYFHNESGAGTGPNDVMWDANHGYLNYRNLKALNKLHTHDSNTRPSHPTGVNPPPLMDFGFAFTPGAHNENTKITIYCTLRVQTSTPAPVHRRFAAAQDTTNAPPADNIVTENIHIEKGFNRQRAALSINGLGQLGAQSAGTAQATEQSSSNVATAVLAAVCAVLLAAVVGMALFVRTRLQQGGTPKRVGSGGALS